MKKTLLFCMLFAGCVSALAQDGYFVSASYGMGSTSSSFHVFSGDAYKNHGNIFSQQKELNFGYTRGNWQLETGAGYLLTGVSFVKPPFTETPGPGGGGCVTPPNENSFPEKFTVTNTHVVVPLVLGYVLNKKKALSFIPGIGIEAFCNLKGSMKMNDEYQNDVAEPTDNYNNISAALVVKCDVQYKISRQFSLWCSPSYQNMISSLTTKIPGDYMTRTYDRAFLLSAGLKYNFHFSHQHNTTVSEKKG